MSWSAFANWNWSAVWHIILGFRWGLWTCSSWFRSCRSESLGSCSFLLFCCIVFSNVRVGVRQWGPELAGWSWGRTYLTFHLQKSLHIFDDCRVGAKSCAPWCALDYCIVWSLLNIWVPCMDVIFTSTSTTSIRSLHLKNRCRKLHLGWSKHAISLFIWNVNCTI